MPTAARIDSTALTRKMSDEAWPASRPASGERGGHVGDRRGRAARAPSGRRRSCGARAGSATYIDAAPASRIASMRKPGASTACVPKASGASRNHAASGISSFTHGALDVVRLPVEIGAPQEQDRAADAQELRHADRGSVSRTFENDGERTRNAGASSSQPAAQARMKGLRRCAYCSSRRRAEDRGADRAGGAWVDDNRRRNWRGARQTSSSSASSARSMMKRKRADASLPISSLMTRSVTI